jgi:hypothetical protein
VRRAFGIAISASALLAGCLPGLNSTAYPLYQKVGDGPGADKVAILRGPIAIVDGGSVTGKGSTFELLPGCHVVRLQHNVGAGSEGGAWSGTLPDITFAFEMKPAHTYTVQTRFEDSGSPYAPIEIVAQEYAPDGSRTRVRQAGDYEVNACRDWAKAQGL